MIAINFNNKNKNQYINFKKNLKIINKIKILIFKIISKRNPIIIIIKKDDHQNQKNINWMNRMH